MSLENITDPILKLYLRRTLLKVLSKKDEQLLGELKEVSKEISLIDSTDLDRVGQVQQKFELTDFEVDILLLCLGTEVEAEFEINLPEILNGYKKKYPTFYFAFNVFENASWNAFSPSGSLRKWKLLFVDQGPIIHSKLSVNEETMFFLLGRDYLDQYFEGMMDYVPFTDEIYPSHKELAENLAKIIKDHPSSELPIIQIYGNDSFGKRGIVSYALNKIKKKLFVLGDSDIPANPFDRSHFIRNWQQQALLGNCALMIEMEDSDKPETKKNVVSLIEKMKGLVFLSSSDAIPPQLRQMVRIENKPPTTAEQIYLWKSYLGENIDLSSLNLEKVIEQFRLNVRKIRNASSDVLGNLKDGDDIQDLIWHHCRVQARKGMDSLAERIDSKINWEDIFLADPQRETINEILSTMQHRNIVYEKWGFTSKSKRGTGIIALFSGPSGTGKTLAAEVIANELKLDLYKIDISSIVSKYIGETEKNLKLIFDNADESGAILLFDEADSIFAKRGEVKNSNDRSANMLVGYLLQRMEQYRGLAILTSNFSLRAESNQLKHFQGKAPELVKSGSSAIDTAFLRRIRYIVNFELPSVNERAKIWQNHIPKNAPVDELDYQKLAKLNASGGMIRNIALKAAFIAAIENKNISMEVLKKSATYEYKKAARQLDEREVSDW